MARLPDTDALRHVVLAWAKEHHVSHGPLARMCSEIAEDLLTVREEGSVSQQPIPTEGAICLGYWTPPGQMMWRSLWLDTHEIILQGQEVGGSINVSQWLSLVQAIQALDDIGWDGPIYSDSYVGVKWVREKQFRTASTVPQWIEDLARSFVTTPYPLRERVQWWNPEVWGVPPGAYGGKDYRQAWVMR